MTLHGKIVVIKRNGADGAHFPLTAEQCLFGRTNECDIRIQLPNVSREHCRIDVQKDGEVHLVNLSQVNPTLLNGKAVMDKEAVQHKDVFTIVDRSFRFEYPPGSKRRTAGNPEVQSPEISSTTTKAPSAGGDTPHSTKKGPGSKPTTPAQKKAATPAKGTPKVVAAATPKSPAVPKTPKSTKKESPKATAPTPKSAKKESPKATTPEPKSPAAPKTPKSAKKESPKATTPAPKSPAAPKSAKKESPKATTPAPKSPAAPKTPKSVKKESPKTPVATSPATPKTPTSAKKASPKATTPKTKKTPVKVSPKTPTPKKASPAPAKRASPKDAKTPPPAKRRSGSLSKSGGKARTSADSGTVLMKRSLLVKAGQALSPDAFMLVLESERAPKAGGRGADSIIAQLGAKARNFKKSTKKASGHVKRLGSENERERARLWGYLAKTARKQEVWDICRVAARFCLLYDDDRWSKPPSPSRPETRQDNSSAASEQPPTSETPTSRKKSQNTVTPEPVLGLSDKDLIRMLAEVHFLNSEALIHLLRTENVEMYNKPIPPVDKRKHPKGYIAKKPEEDPDWIDYCDFIKYLTASSTTGFLRAAELGVTLNESWIVCSAASYFWNYTNHVMTENRHRELVNPFSSLLQALKKVGHSSETVLLVNLCNALAVGLVLPWIPRPDSEQPDQPTPPQGKGKGSKDPDPSPRKAKSVASHTSGKSKMVLAVDPEGGSDIKQALEVCDYAINVTNGTRPLDLVPIAIRHPLLITWTRVKQLLSQQIQKNLGTEDESNMEGQRPLTRCLVALEMLTLNGNGIMDFKDAPSLNDLSNLVEQCQWPDPSVELQVWSRLAYLAYKSKNHSLVMRCAAKAMAFDAVAIKNRRLDEHKQMVWYEMLSYASCVLGQSHVRSMDGNNAVRRSAMEAFLYSARYGRKANNYDLVITAARRYWNACLVLISEPMERQLLKEPLKSILECINATYKKDVKVKTDDSDDDDDDGGAPTPRTVASTATNLVSSTLDILSDPEDDITLRAAIYGVLFQAYADQMTAFGSPRIPQTTPLKNSISQLRRRSAPVKEEEEGVSPAKKATPKKATPKKATHKKTPSKAPTPKSAGKSAKKTPASGKKRKSSSEAAPSAKRKRVSFGPTLSPEQFDKYLPPLTPVKRGQSPARRSLGVATLPVPKRKSFNKRASIAAIVTHPVIQEEPSPKKSPAAAKAKASPKPSPKASPKAATPKALPKAATPKAATPKASPKAATPKASKASTPKASPKAATPKASPKAATPKATPKASPKAATPKAATPKATPKASPKAATPKASPKAATPKATPKAAAPKATPKATPKGRDSPKRSPKRPASLADESFTGLPELFKTPSPQKISRVSQGKVAKVTPKAASVVRKIATPMKEEIQKAAASKRRSLPKAIPQHMKAEIVAEAAMRQKRRPSPKKALSTPLKTAIKKGVQLKKASPKPTTPAKAASPKPTTPKATTPKAATPKAATPKATTPKAATPKAATSKATTPKAATPKAATPKAVYVLFIIFLFFFINIESWVELQYAQQGGVNEPLLSLGASGGNGGSSTPYSTGSGNGRHGGIQFGTNMEKLLMEAQRESRSTSREGSQGGSPKGPPSPVLSSNPSAPGSVYSNGSGETQGVAVLMGQGEGAKGREENWIWDWSSRPEPLPPKEFRFKHPNKEGLSLRKTKAMRSNFFSAEILSVFIPSLLLTNLFALGMGVFIGFKIAAPRSS